VLQPEYNLYHRSAFEGALCDLCISREIGVVTYYSLASGFLTGKYRQQSDLAQSQRGSGIGSTSIRAECGLSIPWKGRRSAPCKTG
jgi:aryl-alcohol dehydrogenase-like predicted oxidoreductase